MSDSEVCLVIHFNGELTFGHGNPVYNGGDQKMIFVSNIITFSLLVQKAVEATNWIMQDEDPRIQYLYHNGRAFTLINLKGDDDLHTMFKAFRKGTDAIYLYVHRKSNDGTNSCQTQSRPQLNKRFGGSNKTSGGRSKHRVSRPVADASIYPPPAVDASFSPPYLLRSLRGRNSMMSTPSSNTPTGVKDRSGTSKRVAHRSNGSSMSPIRLNMNTPATCDTSQMETTSAHTYVNIRDNENIHSSYAADDVAAEIDVPEDDHDDGGSENDSDYLDDGSGSEDDLSEDGLQLASGPKSMPPIPKGSGEHHNAARECTVVDTLIPCSDQTVDEHAGNSSRDLWIGRQFPNSESLRTTLRKFAMYNNFALKPVKSNKKQVIARCADVTCPWRIHASVLKSGGPHFEVRTYCQNHTCSRPTTGLAHRQATQYLIADFIKESLRLDPKYTPKKIISDFQNEYGVVINYRKAQRAKYIAMHDIQGSFEDSFNILPDYCLELQRTNPGTITHLLKEDDNSFSRFFWAYGSSIQSFNSSLRPLIAVDGTYLHGKYPGVLLCAMTYDGDHRLFPLAFAIAESESLETWEWFLATVNHALGSIQNLTIVSNQQENLVKAVRQRFPNANHCYCVRHISQSMLSVFKDEGIVAKFWNAARAYRPIEHERHMSDIRNISEEAYTWIEGIGKQYWANAFVVGRRYDMLTTNIDDFTNSLLKDMRELPITKLVEEIHSKLLKIYESRRHSSQTMHTRVTPYAEKILNTEVERACQLRACAASPFVFQIHSTDDVYVVNLDRRSCSCRKWDVLGIPCSHAVAAIKLKGLDPYDFCEHWFSAEAYQLTYNDILHATQDMGQWERSGVEVVLMEVLPPHTRRPPGRPKKIKMHIKDRIRSPYTCSNCKQRGHNHRTCPSASSTKSIC